MGSSESLPIRAARVSALIWIVMAVGALVLFGMIGYRLPGQIRQRRAELAALPKIEASQTLGQKNTVDALPITSWLLALIEKLPARVYTGCPVKGSCT